MKWLEMIKYSMKVNISEKPFETIFSQPPISGEKIGAIRAMVVDGEGMMGTCDYRTDRINVEISNKKIVKIRGAN
jgi:hypothetical protein